jgi:NhaA family Na+:H+ antiporter
MFGLVSAGVQVGTFAVAVQPLPLAIMAGLFLGKQIGVFGAIWLTIKAELAPMPSNARWSELYGASVLCGIGFTMSLFIGALAFEGSPQAIEAAKLGTLAGSLLSAIAGWMILRIAAPQSFTAADREEAEEIFGGGEEAPR